MEEYEESDQTQHFRFVRPQLSRLLEKQQREVLRVPVEMCGGCRACKRGGFAPLDASDEIHGRW